MTGSQKLWTAILIVAAATGLLLVAFWPRAGEPAPEPRPTSTSTATLPGGIEPTGTTTPEPTSTDDPENPDYDESLDGDGDVIDFTEHRIAAGRAVEAYATVIPGESQEDRAARLAPYFAPGSTYLTTPPRIANPQGYEGVEASVQPTREAMSGVGEKLGDGYEFSVVMSYRATYTSGGQTTTVMKTAVWKLTTSTDFDGTFRTIVEPSNLG